MSQSPPSPSANRDLICVVLILAVAMVVFHLWMASTGRAVNRAQHLCTAVDYARGQIDLLRPIVAGANANNAPTPLDFPIWQAITAALMKLFGIWYGWGNVVSLIFLFTSLWPLFDLTQRLFSGRTAWWAMIFYLLQPLNFITGGSAGGDGTAWAFATWFVYFVYRMMKSGGWVWWLAATVAGSLSAVTKAPFFMVAGLTVFFWLVTDHRQSRLAWAHVASAGALSFAVFWVWNIHGHHCFIQAEFPLINLDITAGGDVRTWYFGDLAIRLNPAQWLRFGYHLLVSVLGNFGFVAFPLAALWLRGTRPIWLWLFAALVSTLVFTPLIFGHEHYLFIFSPGVAVLCACAAVEFEPVVWQKLRANTLLRFVVVFSFTASSLAEGLLLDKVNLCFDRYYSQIGQIIQEHTTPTEKIVVWGIVWGEPFLHAERDGLTGGFGFASTSWLTDSRKIARLKELGYTSIVLMNPSPMVVAASEASGAHSERMVELPAQLPEVIRNWPVATNTSSILILRIPGT